MYDTYRGIVVRPKQLTDITASFTEPVSLADMKEHLRVDFDHDDALITSQITAARLHIEEKLNISLGVHQYRADIECFADKIQLTRGPFVSLDKVEYWNDESPESLTTLLDTGSPETTTDVVGFNKGEGYVYRTYGATWPATAYRKHDAVQITYTAGIASPKENIIAALKLIVGSLYENREQYVTGTIVSENPTVQMLLEPEREWQ